EECLPDLAGGWFRPAEARNKVRRDSLEFERRPARVGGPAYENEWISRDAWGEGHYRSCGFDPSVSFDGPDARPGRYDRGRAGTRLSEQSAAQRPACHGARHRRGRTAGFVGLSPEGRGHRQRRLSLYRRKHDLARYDDTDS